MRGMFIEAAGWDYSAHTLCESEPKVSRGQTYNVTLSWLHVLESGWDIICCNCCMAAHTTSCLYPLQYVLMAVQRV